jgi:chorismate mutase
VLDQCSEALEDRLRSHHSYLAADQDGITLLIIIKTLLHTLEERQKLADALAEVKEKFYSFRQGRHMSLQRYHELFLAQLEVLREVGVSVADNALIEAIASSNGWRVPNKKDQADAQEQALPFRFIRGTNQQYSGYLTHLRNIFLDGNDNYPRTLHAAYNVLERRESEQTFIQSSGDGVAFANVGSGSGSTHNLDQITCYNCRKSGHYANTCQSAPQHQQDQNGALTHGTNEFLFS